MLTLAVLVALGEAEVDDEDVVSRGFCPTDQEIVRLDITMNDPLLVNLLNSLDKLRGNHEDCFQVELAATGLEKVFKGWSEQVHDHDMEVLVGDRAISADVVKAGHASYKNAIQRWLIIGVSTNHLILKQEKLVWRVPTKTS